MKDSARRQGEKSLAGQDSWFYWTWTLTRWDPASGSAPLTLLPVANCMVRKGRLDSGEFDLSHVEPWASTRKLEVHGVRPRQAPIPRREALLPPDNSFLVPLFRSRLTT